MLVTQGRDDVIVVPENAKRLAAEFPSRVAMLTRSSRRARLMTAMTRKRRCSSSVLSPPHTVLTQFAFHLASLFGEMPTVTIANRTLVLCTGPPISAMEIATAGTTLQLLPWLAVDRPI